MKNMSNRGLRDRFRRQKGERGDFPSKVEENLRARVNSGRKLISDEISVVKGAGNKQLAIVKDGVNKVLDLEPVPALVDTVLDTAENVVDVPLGLLDNIGNFIKDQASITRDWVPKR